MAHLVASSWMMLDSTAAHVHVLLPSKGATRFEISLRPTLGLVDTVFTEQRTRADLLDGSLASESDAGRAKKPVHTPLMCRLWALAASMPIWMFESTRPSLVECLVYLRCPGGYEAKRVRSATNWCSRSYREDATHGLRHSQIGDPLLHPRPRLTCGRQSTLPWQVVTNRGMVDDHGRWAVRKELYEPLACAALPELRGSPCAFVWVRGRYLAVA